MAIHVAEEARHISLGHEYLSKRVPTLRAWKRFLLSLFVPLIMRLLGSAVVKPPKAFRREFGMPRKVKRQLYFRSPESRHHLRGLFADVRMLCYDTGLMNPVARLMWRICRINGEPSRYRSEPQRQHPVGAYAPLELGALDVHGGNRVCPPALERGRAVGFRERPSSQPARRIGLRAARNRSGPG